MSETNDKTVTDPEVGAKESEDNEKDERISKLNRESASHRVNATKEKARADDLQQQIDEIKEKKELAGFEDKTKLKVLEKKLDEEKVKVKDLEQYKTRMTVIEEGQKEELEGVLKKLSPADREMLDKSSMSTEEKIKLAQRFTGEQSSSPQPGKAEPDSAKKEELLKKYRESIEKGTLGDTMRVVKEMKEHKVAVPSDD